MLHAILVARHFHWLRPADLRAMTPVEYEVYAAAARYVERVASERAMMGGLGGAW